MRDVLGDAPVCVLNPSAGEGVDRRWLTAALARELGEDRVGLVVTERPGDAERLARDALRRGATALIAAGGDGTLHGVVNGLVLEDGAVPVGVLPLGTANDFVRSAGLPGDPDLALRSLAAAEVRSVDLIRVALEPDTARARLRVAVNACTGGISGAVALDASDEDKAQWGQLAYAKTAFDLLTDDVEPYEVRYRLDDVDGDGRILVAAVANGGRAGGGVPVAPGAEVDDRTLDVVLVRDAPVSRILAQLPRLTERTADRAPGGEDPGGEAAAVLHRLVRTVEMEASRPMPWSLDGEPTEASRVRFRLAAGRLGLLFPAAGERP